MSSHADVPPIMIVPTDSIVANCIRMAPLYEKRVKTLHSTVYTKAVVTVKKKNELIRLIPSEIRLSSKSNQYIQELISDVRFNAPDIYESKVIAYNNTSKNNVNPNTRILPFLKINVFSQTYLSNTVISPLSEKARMYYNYDYNEVAYDEDGSFSYRIKITPKYISQLLVSGYMDVIPKTWGIKRVAFNGEYAQTHFNVEIKLQELEKEVFVVEEHKIDINTHFFGNTIKGLYHTHVDVDMYQLNDTVEHSGYPIRYDLSSVFTPEEKDGKMEINSDQSFWEQNRPISLSADEAAIFNLKKDTIRSSAKRSSIVFDPISYMLSAASRVSSPVRSNANDYMQLDYRGIANPALFDYSKADGLIWKQDLMIGKEYAGSRVLQFHPQLGYAFKSNDFYWGSDLSFLYNPEKRGYLNIGLGNGNKIYNSQMFDKLKSDSVLNLDSVHFQYYNELNFKVGVSQEILSGLELSLSLRYYIRSPKITDTSTSSNNGELGQLNDDYRSFAPMLRLTWTPAQYYRFEKKKKIYLQSSYPTLNLEYERGIAGALKSQSKYERIELDLSQSIDLGLLRFLHYEVGAGLFTNTHSLYFANFSYFSKRTLPTNWNDTFGGVFEVLDNRWFGSADRYVQMHLQWQAPLLFSRHFPALSKWMVSERLYAGSLSMPSLPSYSELGYGIGNHIFNAALFTSFRGVEFDGVGFKFSLELFNAW
ncbi:MAG: DUF5686 family protein [Bacteroidales bacterium]|nr:DUF5686 family protein [Bacteroidales bacterium]